MSLYGTTNAFGKDMWLPGVTNQLENTPGTFYSDLSKIEPMRVEGRNAYFKVETTDSLGQSVIREAGDFPQPIDPGYDEATLAMARLAHTIQLTFEEYEMLNTDAAAAVPVVARKMKKAVEKMQREIARQSLMDGSAVLARCDTTTAATVVVLQQDVATSANQVDRDAFNWIAPGRTVIDIVNATTGAAIANGTGRTVAAVDRAAGTVTLDAAGGNVTTSTSHVITWADSVEPFSSGSYVSGEFAGLNAILGADRTYLGIDSSAAGNSYWDATIVDGSTSGTNEAISLERYMTLLNTVALSADSGMQPDAAGGYKLYSNHGVVSAAIALLDDKIRYVNPGPGSTPDLSGGWRTVEGMGIEWRTDVHYPRYVLDILHMPSLHFVKPKNPLQEILDFLTLDSGSIWHLGNAAAGQGHAAFARAYLTGMCGMMTDRPSNHGRLTDVTEVGT